MTYIETLFDAGESICHGGRFETTVRPRDTLAADSEFVALNPLRDRRLDANVTCFRNLLIESDTLSLEVQRLRMKALGLPYSAAVFSGGKSIHFIISMETPAANRAEYDYVARRIYKGLESLDFLVDAACKNPSRFTRNPGHHRADRGCMQELLELQGRIPVAELNKWLDRFAPNVPEPRQFGERSRWQRTLSGHTINFLLMGAPAGERHRACLRAALDMAECGLPQDECIQKLSRAPGIEVGRSVMDAVRWAYNRCHSA